MPRTSKSAVFRSTLLLSLFKPPRMTTRNEAPVTAVPRASPTPPQVLRPGHTAPARPERVHWLQSTSTWPLYRQPCPTPNAPRGACPWGLLPGVGPPLFLGPSTSQAHCPVLKGGQSSVRVTSWPSPSAGLQCLTEARSVIISPLSIEVPVPGPLRSLKTPENLHLSPGHSHAHPPKATCHLPPAPTMALGKAPKEASSCTLPKKTNNKVFSIQWRHCLSLNKRLWSWLVTVANPT